MFLLIVDMDVRLLFPIASFFLPLKSAYTVHFISDVWGHFGCFCLDI